MARKRNRLAHQEHLAPHEREAKSGRRTNESVSQVVPREQISREQDRTVPAGLPLVGSEVLEAIGSNAKVGRAMHNVIYAPDDDNMERHLGPEQEASVSFHPDHALGDAGADFAEDFGREFLMAATTGEDIGEIEDDAMSEPSEVEGAIEEDKATSDELEDLTEYAEPADDAPPSTHR